MPTSIPVPSKSPGDVFTSTMWNSYLRDNLNKLLSRGHRRMTVAQFSALTGIEDGDEAYVAVDEVNGIDWHFLCVTGEPTYKWKFLGGPEMFSEVTTAESTASASYVALTTAGPSLVLPRSGDYNVAHGGEDSSTTSTSGLMSYDIGGTGAADADAAGIMAAGGGVVVTAAAARLRRKTGLGSVTLTAKYKALSGTPPFRNRWIRAVPVRVRHDA